MGKSNSGGVQQPNVTPDSTGAKGTRSTDSHGSSPAATSNATSGTSSASQGVPRSVVVDISSGTVKNDPKSKNRPTGLKYNKTDKPKAPAKSTSGPTAETLILVQSITQALFVIPSTRLGEHWKLTDEEAASIARPAGALVHRYFGALDEHSDAAALAIALGSVLIGRVMIQVTLPKKEGKKDGPKQPNQSRPIEAASAKPAGQSQQPSADNDQTSTKQLLESFPAASY